VNPRRGSRELTGSVPLLVFVCATAMHLARLPARAWQTMYAEDGFTFLHDSAAGWTWWWEPYAGYLHVLPRAVATAVSSFVPVHDWALGMAVGAGMIVGLVATTAYAVTRHLGGSQIVAWAAAAFPAVVPVAGIESIANVGNSHSFVLYGALFALVAKPEGRWRWVLAGLALAFAASEIQTVLLMPVVVGLFLLDRGGRAARWPTSMAVVLGVAGQAVAYLTIGRAAGGSRPSAVAVMRGWLFDGFLGAVLARQGQARLIVQVGTWWLLVLLALIWIGIVLWALRESSGLQLFGLGLMTVSFGAWSMPHVFNNYATVNFDDGPFKMVRWGVTPALMVLATVVLVAGVVIDGTRLGTLATARAAQDSALLRRVAIGCLSGLLILQMASLRLPTMRDSPLWPTEVNKAQARCESGSISETLPILPGDAEVELPCAVLLR